MVQPGLRQQRQTDAGRIVARQRLGVVVEIDQQGFVEAGLDEAVGVPVEALIERIPGQVAVNILDQHLTFEVRDRSSF